MFSQSATFAMLVLPLLAVATAVARGSDALAPTSACCQSALSPISASGSALLGLLAMLGVDTNNVNGDLGLQCTTVTAAGLSSGSELCVGAAMSCSKGVVGGVGTGCVAVTF